MIPSVFIGAVEIAPSWLMFLIGIILMMVYSLRNCARYGLTKVGSVVFTLLLSIVGLLGAKLLYVIEEFEYVVENGLSLGGVSFFGSVFLIPPLMALLGILFRMRPVKTMDLCAPNVAIMISCMRFGCLMNGCCGGHRITIMGINVALPVQLLEVIFDVGIFCILNQRSKDKAISGTGYPVFLVSYGTVRFVLEFMRTTEKDWLGMSHGQWFSLISILFGSLIISKLKRNSPRGELNAKENKKQAKH